jgi:hypothetical protein
MRCLHVDALRWKMTSSSAASTFKIFCACLTAVGDLFCFFYPVQNADGVVGHARGRSCGLNPGAVNAAIAPLAMK